MGHTKIDKVKKAAVLKWLEEMNETERMELIDKYSKKTRDVCHNLSGQEYIDISIDIYLLKSSKDNLVNSYLNEDTVADHPECRFNEYLNNEMAAKCMQSS